MQEDPKQVNFSDEHEYLVCYAKDANEKIEIGYEKSSKDFIHKDKDGNYFREIGLRQRGGSGEENKDLICITQFILTLKMEKYLAKNNTYCEISLLIRPSSGEDGRWTWGKEKFEKDKGLLWVEKLIERVKKYGTSLEKIIQGMSRET